MLKIAEFPKISIKMVISKHFASPKQQAARSKLFSPPPPDKSFLCLWNKYGRGYVWEGIGLNISAIPATWSNRTA